MAGEIPADVIPVFEDADPPRRIHPTHHRLWFGLWCFGDLHLTINHLDSADSVLFTVEEVDHLAAHNSHEPAARVYLPPGRDADTAEPELHVLSDM